MELFKQCFFWLYAETFNLLVSITKYSLAQGASREFICCQLAAVARHPQRLLQLIFNHMKYVAASHSFPLKEKFFEAFAELKSLEVKEIYKTKERDLQSYTRSPFFKDNSVWNIKIKELY